MVHVGKTDFKTSAIAPEMDFKNTFGNSWSGKIDLLGFLEQFRLQVECLGRQHLKVAGNFDGEACSWHGKVGRGVRSQAGP